jgi:hypothetical protein
MQNKGHIRYLGRLEKLDDQGAYANDELKFVHQQGLDLFVEKRWKDAVGKGYCYVDYDGVESQIDSPQSPKKKKKKDE